MSATEELSQQGSPAEPAMADLPPHEEVSKLDSADQDSADQDSADQDSADEAALDEERPDGPHGETDSNGNTGPDEAVLDAPAGATAAQLPFVLMRLSPDKILGTTRTLQRRIDERFPQSGLGEVCAQLCELARRAEATAAAIQRPERPWQILRWSVIGLLIVALTSGLIAVLSNSPAAPPTAPMTFSDAVQVGESTINDLILLGGAIWFFWSLDTRRKRTKVIHAVNQLRTVAHLVDVHQLTKSPETLGYESRDTASSPKRQLSPYEMSRYLDYCSEMLSLVGKIGALYSEAFDDSDALEAVSELESFSTGVQGRIWQKIILLQSRVDERRTVLLSKTDE